MYCSFTSFLLVVFAISFYTNFTVLNFNIYEILKEYVLQIMFHLNVLYEEIFVIYKKN